MSVIILFGPPGVGKGTQAELLAKNLGYVHLSTGVILREEVKSGSELGKEIAKIIDGGHLVPDKMVDSVIKEFIEKNKEKGVILDGYPRKVSQARKLDEFLEELDIQNLRIVNLLADEEELMERLLLRAEKQKRVDDTEETIKERFKVYDQETFPILDYYENTGVEIFNIDGVGKIEDIQKEILKKIAPKRGAS